jgi:hypothetical protein
MIGAGVVHERIQVWLSIMQCVTFRVLYVHLNGNSAINLVSFGNRIAVGKHLVVSGAKKKRKHVQ